ncbi:hypothetical protein [Proteus vulgaris]|uniref:hypothetical protein n=1 Tax=Proteus vulgaris TaxID=585 RepID=UPI000657C987|nr:hypothetical protein [Proteus vulgaris]CRL63821.1 hypothetical protein BN1805_02490 [Proteus vulgaris]
MTTIFKTPFATQGDKASIPVEIQPDGSVSYTQGYGYDYERDQVTDPAAKDIEREKMNGIFHDITEAIGEIQSFGFPKWSEAGKPYAIRTIVYHKNKVWQSKVENNNIEPVAGNAWAELKADATASDVGAYSKGESDKRFQPLGNYTPSGHSYSKAETDTKYQPKGNYAPAGNYANKGDSYTKTESDGRYQAKGSYQPSGDYATNSALNSGLNNKFDKGNVAQGTGTSTVHVMSQKASTDAFQPKGNYQTKGNYALAGASYTKTESDGRYQAKGSYATAGSSYTKAESDGRYQGKGNYQPAGNYALVGASYTKAESDGKYQPKGNYAPAGNYVPSARKINNKQLSNDINLTANDVGALGSNQALGFGQDYQDVTSSRAINTDYKNDTNRPIMISIIGRSNGTHHSYFKVNGKVAAVVGGSDTIAIDRNFFAIVKPGATYRMESSKFSFVYWGELK